MNILSKKAGKKVLALDLDAEVNSLVYVELLPSDIRIIGWKVIDLFDIAIPEKEDYLRDALVNFLKEFSITRREVHISLHGPSVYTSYLALPSLPPKDIPQALKWQLPGKIPFPIEGTIFDYELISEKIESDGVKKITLAVVSALKEEIEKLCGLVEKAGLHPAKISLSPFCFRNLISLLKEFTPDEVFACLEIGWQNSEFSFYQEKKPIFSRQIPVGINNFVHALQTAIVYNRTPLSLSSQQAYRILKEVGLPPDTAGDWQGFPYSQIIVLLRPELEKLVIELNRSLDYFTSNFKEGTIEKIFVTGPGLTLKGMLKFLEENINNKIEILPIMVKGVPQQESVVIACALGNALAEEPKP
ncbi:MAG: pilus assembly protein PilM, partial [Candidatus Omnitrophica bacterium]|nr:pilus assembly protein PilM [Candidatus Omnitrophota bacterium]